jgi:exodeoxyribonuclease V alpha subunit
MGLTEKVAVITGGPGVGKTTLVKSLARIFIAKKQRMVLAAPTGRAAKRLAESTGLEAKTVHRLLEFEPIAQSFVRNREKPIEGDIVIIDEASMMDVLLMYRLVDAVPLGAVLIIIGDVDQLPSVGSGAVLRDLIDSRRIPVCRLTHIFRQQEAGMIITNAHRVNSGVMPFLSDHVLRRDRDFFFYADEDPARAADRVVELVSHDIPRVLGLNPVHDVHVLCPMHRGELGAEHMNSALQQRLNPHGRELKRFGVPFRVGDKVMQIVNNYTKQVFNGDIGFITTIDPEAESVTVEFDGTPHEYDGVELEELMLAYATTIHKSQGSEYPVVVIPVHRQHTIMLYRNLLYTAITRAKRYVILVGEEDAIRMAIRRTRSHERVTTLKARLGSDGGVG